MNEDGYGPSDHSSFYGKQIPVLFFWTGTHSDYHKPSDTFEKINYDDEARILSLVARIVRDVDGAEKRLTYTTAKAEPAARWWLPRLPGNDSKLCRQHERFIGRRRPRRFTGGEGRD